MHVITSEQASAQGSTRASGLMNVRNSIRNSHWRYSVRNGVLRNFAKFTRKHLCQSLFFNKACNFIKKETLAQVFSCEFCKNSRNTFFTEHLWATDSVTCFCSTTSECDTFC